ncbi:unnamed protein product [Rhizophagus irregularis]|nr:unnamed protein product [Rhizophagus irregularis]
MQNTKNTNEWVNWIEESISKEYYRLYEQKHFSNIQKVGIGGFGKVYRASWKNPQYFALKSFFNFDDVTAKEIVHELKLQRDIQFHNNIIKFYGIAKFDLENDDAQSKNYLLVMDIPISLASCIVICTLNKNLTQIFSLNEKSDIYSVGVLFWEISSGQPPFYIEDDKYDIDLAIEISQGLREVLPISNTPEDYIKIYAECWNGEPDIRPTINQVVEKLKEL